MVLQKIFVCKVEEVVECCVCVNLVEVEWLVCSVDVLCGFVNVLLEWVKCKELVVIVEIKKVLLSKGVLCEYFVLVEIVCSYEVGGVVCLLVFIDVDFFQGVDVYLKEVWVVCVLLVICKDFMIDLYQIVEVWVIGVDCILLIVLVLDDVLMVELVVIVKLVGFDVLVEVYDGIELECVLKILDMLLVGINNCNLYIFEVSLEIIFDLLLEIFCDCLVVIESGIFNWVDVELMEVSEVYVFLVGEVFMWVDDFGLELKCLFFQECGGVVLGVDFD